MSGRIHFATECAHHLHRNGSDFKLFPLLSLLQPFLLLIFVSISRLFPSSSYSFIYLLFFCVSLTIYLSLSPYSFSFFAYLFIHSSSICVSIYLYSCPHKVRFIASLRSTVTTYLTEQTQTTDFGK